MREMILKSDTDQRHRRWFNCIKISYDLAHMIADEAGMLAQEQELIFQAHEPLIYYGENGNPENVYVLGFRAGDERERSNFPLAIQFLATYRGGDSDIVFRSYFPVYDDGAEVAVTLTAIHEWENGAEATLEGTILDGSHEIFFYDTRYALCKNIYKVGETYRFKLAGFAHTIEVLKNTKEVLSPKATEMLCQQTGKRLRRDADGNIIPMSIETKDMVAFVSRGREYPEDHEFQSTIRGVDETDRRAEKHFVLKIACARDDDGKEIEIPLIVKPDLLDRAWPKVRQCVRGILWMQGYCVLS